MKKFGVIATSLAVFVGIGAYDAYAAYPAYPTYQAITAQGKVITLPRGVTVAGAIPVNTNAANPTRITGALPRVGSSSINAGRRYYQPQDYDRLADSGLYIGLSAGYSMSVMGSVSADYKNERDGYLAPGAFKDADFDSDTVIPWQVSLGATINNDLRADFSFSRYARVGYPDSVDTFDGVDSFVPTQVSGGAITANATMLNIYYYIDSFTGYLAGGMLRPYIGAGAGISLNSIADYVVYDPTFYSEQEPEFAEPGTLTGVSDVTAYHNGGTTEQFAFAFELGLSTGLSGGVSLDLFVRYANLGKIKTSGSIVVSQIEWLADPSAPGGEIQAPYDSVAHYTNWQESGRLSTFDLGARLRLQF